MIKFFRDKNDKKGTVSVTIVSPNKFYQVINIVREYLVGKDGRVYKISTSSLFEILNRFVENRIVEHIHVQFPIITEYFAKKVEEKSLVRMRDSIDGYDSGVELAGEHELLPFQHVGVEFMYKIRNGIIADKVGLGKTIQGLAVSKKFQDNGESARTLLIVKSTTKKNWQREAKKFLHKKAVTLDGPVAERMKIWDRFVRGKHRYAIITYDTLRNDHEAYLKNMPRTFNIVADEIQLIKNHGAKRTVAFGLLSSHANCVSRIGLTATYIETGLQDMFGIMYHIDKAIFGSNGAAFTDKYCIMSYMGKVDGYKNIPEAARKMKLCSVRRRKEEVKGQLSTMLPAVVQNNLWVDLTKSQKKLYNQVLMNVIENIANMERAEKISVANALAQIVYLRQAALANGLFDFKPFESAKIDALVDTLPEILEDGNKVVIFTYFTGFVDIIEQRLKAEGIPCIAMHGKRTEGLQKNRQDNIDKLSDSKSIHVLVTSDILSEGVNIPAASYVINMDILWNPAKMTQRNGRIDRLNQTAPTIYNINILTNGTVEEEMWDRIYNRERVALEVMDGGEEESRIKKLSFKDLKSMLKVVR